MARGSRTLAQQVRSQHRVDAVGADDDPRCHLAVQHDPVGAHLDPAHPAPLAAPRPPRTACSTRRASKTSRGTTCTSRAIGPADAGRRRGPARGDAAASNPRTTSAAPDARRARRARAARCRRRSSCRAGSRPGRAAAPAVTGRRAAHPTPRRRRQVRPPRPRGPRSQAHHEQRRVEQGDPDRGRERRAATPAQHDDAEQRRRRAKPMAAADGETSAPSRTRAEPAPRTTTAAAGRRRAPSRCGRPRTPVAASSSMSGSTLRRWAPTPRQAAASGSHSGGAPGVVARQPDEHGQQPERHGVRRPRPDRRLQSQVVGPSGGDADQVHQPGHQPTGQGEDDAQHDRDRTRDHGDTRVQRPQGERLVATADRTVSREVDQVVAPADRQLAAEHRGGHQQHPGRGHLQGCREQRGQHRHGERRPGVSRPDQGHGALGGAPGLALIAAPCPGGATTRTGGSTSVEHRTTYRDRPTPASCAVLRDLACIDVVDVAAGAGVAAAPPAASTPSATFRRRRGRRGWAPCPAWPEQSADLAVSARREGSRAGDVARAVDAGEVVKAYTFRGATHLMTVASAA